MDITPNDAMKMKEEEEQARQQVHVAEHSFHRTSRTSFPSVSQVSRPANTGTFAVHPDHPQTQVSITQLHASLQTTGWPREGLNDTLTKIPQPRVQSPTAASCKTHCPQVLTARAAAAAAQHELQAALHCVQSFVVNRR